MTRANAVCLPAARRERGRSVETCAGGPAKARISEAPHRRGASIRQARRVLVVSGAARRISRCGLVLQILVERRSEVKLYPLLRYQT